LQCTGAQLLVFRDALVHAYNTLPALNEFAITTGLVASLEIDIGLGAGELKDVAFRFLRFVEAKGSNQLDHVLAVAQEHQPGNDKLREFASTVGALTVSAAADLLSTHSFDLRPLEDVWLTKLSDPDRRLAVFVLFGAEQSVVSNVVERLRAYLSPTVSGKKPMYTLKPTLQRVEETVNLIANLKAGLADKGIVCTVYATETQGDEVDRLLVALYKIYPDVLRHPLVLLVNARPDGKVTAPCERLPRPEFHRSHLNQWVDHVTNGRRWPEDLRADFKRWLLQSVAGAETPDTDVAYAALEDAIELLRTNPAPPIDVLRQRFQSAAPSPITSSRI